MPSSSGTASQKAAPEGFLIMSGLMHLIDFYLGDLSGISNFEMAGADIELLASPGETTDEEICLLPAAFRSLSICRCLKH
jgi:hypothetical protein